MRTFAWMFAASALLVACGGGETTVTTAGGPEEAAPEEAAPEEAAPEEPAVDLSTMSDEDKLAWLQKKGEEVYRTGGSGGVACITCHMEGGVGAPPAFPPLVGQKDHMGDCAKHAKLIINGLTGPITVNGVEYNGVMPPQGNLPDIEIAAAVTYVRTSWGNDYGLCLPEDVAGARSAE